MAKDMYLLEDEFEGSIQKVLTDCKLKGVEMRPFYTLRPPIEQARLWRQSRSLKQVEEAVQWLKHNGAPYLADVLWNAGPQTGRWATNALPGFSWHQHGEAIDCFWVVNGRAEWEATDDPGNGYMVYANSAMKHGLTAGHFWKSRDSVHVQKRKIEVEDFMNDNGLTLEWLDHKMKNMFPVY